MLRRLEKAIIWTETKLYEAGCNEYGEPRNSNKQSPLKPGVMADILAHDMMWLQPAKDSKDKLTGANFQTLQAAIAYYRCDILDEVFKSAKLIMSDYKHPFLYKINVRDYHTLQDFYIAYFKERKIYFERVLKNIFRGKLKTRCYPLRDLQKNDSECIEENKDCPVFLPRGIFTDAIKNLMQSSEHNLLTGNGRTGKKTTDKCSIFDTDVL